jgi:3-deoxy-manno-octulosonate cytidylyltransferase (CMP-KDO synthetase)
VVLATDDARILDAARACGVEAVATRADHPSGTDRVCEAARALGVAPDDVVVNIQGDEPALAPQMLDELLAPFADPAVRVTTLARRIDAAAAARPDQVKAVVSAVTHDALYFSRAPVPYDRDGDAGGDAPDAGPRYLGHVGIYAFRMNALEAFTALPPSPLERREKLEQLRLLENGICLPWG